ncbi:diaminopimelate epimerase [Bacillus spongiae]|uniref:Diaminopimelate epimerase n=1 Tax=Bacillus spongiae TaxID=2683610 RepID=A0ABU8HHE4_9BACI
MDIQLIKCHGSGNDFILIDEMEHDHQMTDQDRENLAIALCDRKSSIGADGILFVLESQQAAARMRVFNADGSEASMCGNGLRCVARYICEKLSLSEVLIETMKANLLVSQEKEIYEGIPTYKVEISPVSFHLSDLPLNIERAEKLINETVPELSDTIRFTAVAVPNPHLIAMVDTDQIISNEQKVISEKVNMPNNLFPDGVNVSFVHPLGDKAIYVRTFERGVGFTNACGTAMSASTLIYRMITKQSFETSIDVFNNGGMVRCVPHEVRKGQFKIDLIGNATYVFKASISVDLKTPDKFSVLSKEETDEQVSYRNLEKYAQKVVDEHIFH